MKSYNNSISHRLFKGLAVITQRIVCTKKNGIQSANVDVIYYFPLFFNYDEIHQSKPKRKKKTKSKIYQSKLKRKKNKCFHALVNFVPKTCPLLDSSGKKGSTYMFFNLTANWSIFNNVMPRLAFQLIHLLSTEGSSEMVSVEGWL